MIAVTPSLPNLNELSHTQKDELIVALFAQVQSLVAQQAVLIARIAQLEGRPALHSKNSGKPPSSDGLSKPAPKSLRLSGQKPNGGQKGHSGNTLRQSAQVDETVAHQADSRCSACQRKLLDHAIVETRQVFELPELRIRTVAHQQMRSTCSCGAVHLRA
jgi:transposase